MMNLESMGFKKSSMAIAVSCALLAYSGSVLAVLPPLSLGDDRADDVALKKAGNETQPASLLAGLKGQVQLKTVLEGEKKYSDQTPFRAASGNWFPIAQQQRLDRFIVQQPVDSDSDTDDDWDAPAPPQRLDSAHAQAQVQAVLAEQQAQRTREGLMAKEWTQSQNDQKAQTAQQAQQGQVPQPVRLTPQEQQEQQEQIKALITARRAFVDPDDLDLPQTAKGNSAAELAAAQPPQRTQSKPGLQLMSGFFERRSATPQAAAPLADSSGSGSLADTAGPAPAPAAPQLLQAPQDKQKAQAALSNFLLKPRSASLQAARLLQHSSGPAPEVPQDPQPSTSPQAVAADSTQTSDSASLPRLASGLQDAIRARMAPEPAPLAQQPSASTVTTADAPASTAESSAPARKRLRSVDLTIDSDTRYEFDGKMGRAAKLIKKGRGTLVLNHAGEMRHGVHLKQGRIELGHAQGLGAGSLLMDDGSAIDLAVDGMVVANDIHMTGSDDPEINTGDGHQIWAGAITGAGFLTKQGAGSLTLTNAANGYSGLTEVAQGTLQAGAVNAFSAASVHSVASDARLNLAGFDQTIAGLDNRGTVQFGAAPAAPGTVLTVTGPYVGQGGELAVAAQANASDRLLLSGTAAVASGSTLVRITNVGDLGVATTGNGIEIIATEDGARLESDAFSLAGGHVDAGAHAYRLQQTAQGASLQSSYRAEVPLLAALPAQLRQADMSMLGDMHQRLGNAPGGAGNDRRAWGRMLRTEPRIRQQGTVSPHTSGHLAGFQTGLDLYAGRSANAGFYVGQLKGEMRVKGLAGGAVDQHAGANRLHGRYLGLYASWLGDSGMYADTVLQWADHRSHSHTQDSHAATKGRSRLASLEVGQPFGIDSRWQIEPQVQLVYRQLRLDDTALSHAAVQHRTPGDWTLRVGARLKGSFATRAGVLQPYGSVNIYKASNTSDVARFAVPAAITDIQTRSGHTSTALAAGATLQVNPRTSFYGELSQHWAHGGHARVGSGVQASAGVKVRW